MWTNYWDVNPLEHGGAWVRGTCDCWEVVVAEPEPTPSGEYIVYKTSVYPCDIYNQDGSHEERFQRVIDSMQGDYPIEVYVSHYVRDVLYPDKRYLTEDKRAKVESFGIDV